MRPGCASKPVTQASSAPEKKERRTDNATFWSDKTELYLEYPVLVRGDGVQRHLGDVELVLADQLQQEVERALEVVQPDLEARTGPDERRVVLDQHIGLVAFFLLIVLWLAVTAIKIKLVIDTMPAKL